MFRAHVLIIRRSKLHYTAWNKLIVKQKFCASSWLIIEIHILRCTVSKTSKNSPIFLELLETRRHLFVCVCVCVCVRACVRARAPVWRLICTTEIYAAIYDGTLSCSYPCTNNTISHKIRLMYTCCSATLLTMCHSDMFLPSEGHLQRARLVRFNSRVNKMS